MKQSNLYYVKSKGKHPFDARKKGDEEEDDDEEDDDDDDDDQRLPHQPTHQPTYQPTHNLTSKLIIPAYPTRFYMFLKNVRSLS